MNILLYLQTKTKADNVALWIAKIALTLAVLFGMKTMICTSISQGEVVEFRQREDEKMMTGKDRAKFLKMVRSRKKLMNLANQEVQRLENEKIILQARIDSVYAVAY
jgi:hypothetical protein